METKVLSTKAQQIASDYLTLTLADKRVPTPYFNNQAVRRRAALRVNVGKGSPEEIVEEAKAIAVKKRVDLSELDSEELTRFLVENHLGVDCSGLAYHILDAEGESRGVGSLGSHVRYPLIKNPLRRMLTRLRSNQNVSAATFAHPENSHEIELSEVLPGDIITSIGPHQTTGEELPNHILVIEKVDYDGGKPSVIHYINSIAWPVDGKYNHGTKRGTITLRGDNLFSGDWEEGGRSGKDHYLLERERSAGRTSLRRLNWF